jgi:hypothetical protein
VYRKVTVPDGNEGYTPASKLLTEQARTFQETSLIGCTQAICQSPAIWRGTAFIPLDLLDRGQRTADSISQHLLGQVKRFTLAADPVAKRTCRLHLY